MITSSNISSCKQTAILRHSHVWDTVFADLKAGNLFQRNVYSKYFYVTNGLKMSLFDIQMFE